MENHTCSCWSPNPQALNTCSVSVHKKDPAYGVRTLWKWAYGVDTLESASFSGYVHCLNVKTAPGIRTCYILCIYIFE
jgi:hypothetical protein